MKELVRMAREGFEGMDESLRIQNNEQLEFLGDAILEYICRYVCALGGPLKGCQPV